MAANNETGVLQDVPGLAAMARKAGALFHTDGAQALGKIPFDVSRHRSGVVQQRTRSMARRASARFTSAGAPGSGWRRCSPGAGRSGGCAPARWRRLCWPGLARPAVWPGRKWRRRPCGCSHSAPACWTDWPRALPGLRVNGSMAHRLPGNLNITLRIRDGPCGHGRPIPICASRPARPVLPRRSRRARYWPPWGSTRDEVSRSLRLGLGRFTSAADVDFAIRCAALSAVTPASLLQPIEA